MRVENEPLSGVFEIVTDVFGDGRGSFTETYNLRKFADLGITEPFVQDNQSYSQLTGTVRGLHFQADPDAQGKLVRVLAGRIFDVAVDLRPDSDTYGAHASIELAAGDNRAFWIPTGFAHGFCTLEPDTVVTYKVTDFYAPASERSIHFADPRLGIDWPVDTVAAVLSDKDAAAGSFDDYERAQ